MNKKLFIGFVVMFFLLAGIAYAGYAYHREQAQITQAEAIQVVTEIQAQQRQEQSQKNIQEDQKTEENMTMLQGLIEQYAALPTRSNLPPAFLSDLHLVKNSLVIEYNPNYDSVNQQLFAGIRYDGLAGTVYQLCANFRSENLLRNAGGGAWQHGDGYYCFRLDTVEKESARKGIKTKEPVANSIQSQPESSKAPIGQPGAANNF